MQTTPRVFHVPFRSKIILCRALRDAYGVSLRVAKERLDEVAESLVRVKGPVELAPLPYEKAQALIATWRDTGGRAEIEHPLELLAAEG